MDSFFSLKKLSNICIGLSLETLLQCRLNILAELVRFGDREFYKDWWNAKTVEEVGFVFVCAWIV